MKYCERNQIELIEELKRMNPEVFFNTYLNTNEVWYFQNQLLLNEHEYKNSISTILHDNFDLKDGSFLIVGSAKIGFSLSPYKRLRPFEANKSDIDIAVVSPNIFINLWESLKDLKYKTHINDYPTISSNVFRGFVNDKNLLSQILIKTDVLSSIDNCTLTFRDDFDVKEPINYRFYNSWNDLEKYMIDSVRKCKGVNL